MISNKDFPRLTEQNHRTTSPATPDYNCIAWSARDIEHWWQPGVHWPIATSEADYGIGILEQAFLSLGDTQLPGNETPAVVPPHSRGLPALFRKLFVVLSS